MSSELSRVLQGAPDALYHYINLGAYKVYKVYGLIKLVGHIGFIRLIGLIVLIGL